MVEELRAAGVDVGDVEYKMVSCSVYQAAKNQQVFPLSVQINMANGDQFQDWFTAINPNNKMPAIVDYDTPFGEKGYPVFESVRNACAQNH